MRFILILLFPILCFSQEFDIYFPDGRLITNILSIDEVKDRFFKDIPLYPHGTDNDFYNFETHKGIFIVMFQAFTTKPLFIVTIDGDPSQFKAAINSFRLEDLYKSNDFTIYLDSYIKQKNLKGLYVYDAFGQPKRRETKSDGTTKTDILIYEHPKITFYLINDRVTSYTLEQ